MADDTAKTPTPVKRWAYPFKKKGNPNAKDSKPAKVDNPETYYEALATADDGFYPIGTNGLWHGGIHFGAETAATLAQDDGIVCIADGEVIAYRIDSAYPRVTYNCGEAEYSRGFVLVKHRLQPPPAPKKTSTGGQSDDKAATPTTTNSTAAEEPTLTLFSLYMHLQDLAGYDTNKAHLRPGYWDGEKQYVVSNQSNDKEEKIAPGAVGLRIRDAANKPIAILPRGTKLRLGEQGPKTGYFAIESIISGAPLPADQSSGYVYKKELEAITTPKTTDSVVVLDKPVPIQAGELIGYLGRYQRYLDTRIPDSTGRPLVHIEVFSGEDFKAFKAKSKARAKELDAKQKTLLVIDKGTSLVLPTEADQTIASGVDVKTTDDSPKSGRWAKVVALASTPAPTKKDPNAVTQTPTGEAIWIERSLLNDQGHRASKNVAAKAWSQFPLQSANATGPSASHLRVAAIATLETVATDDKGVRWWEIDVDTPDANYNSLGWACETNRLQSPWEWPGFEVVEETSTLAEQHAKKAVEDEHGTSIDNDDLMAKAERAKEGPLFQRLYDAIDLDKNESLTTTELRIALKKPWLAQTISRVVALYESEWGGDMGKWNALDAHMSPKSDADSGATNGNTDWIAEKKRIEQLKWWNDLSGKHGFPEAPKVSHLHAIGLIGNFHLSCYPLRQAQELALRVSGGYEGRANLDYHALAGNFDAQGTSFGLIQWNFGQNTLGPILLRMYNEDATAFEDCFPARTDYQVLVQALVDSDQQAQMDWAENVIDNNKEGWSEAFHNLGDVPAFQDIQLDAALEYHENVMKCIRLMRGIAPNLMQDVLVVTYAALYDLCVQQGTIDKNSTLDNIRTRYVSENPSNQVDFLRIVVQERAKTASTRWRADAMSRRMGIIERKAYSATESGYSSKRSNQNFHLLDEVYQEHVCDI